jgi:hypothetical protein
LRFAFGLRFTYPPCAALLFAPLGWLPVTAGRVLVTAATVIALPVTCYLALRLPPGPAGRWCILRRDPAAQLALAFSAAAIWLEPERTNLKYGQVNVFLTVLVLADLAWIERGRDRRLGGALIGIAAGIKLTPALFAVYLLATRRYRAAATAGAAFAGTVAVAFALVPGDAVQYWDLSFLDPAHVGRIQNVANQSLLGALARVLHTLSVGAEWVPVAAVAGWAGLIWRVPIGSGHYAELNLTPAQLVAADAYVLVGFGVLVLAASQASASAFHRRLSASGAKQASNELRASSASVASSKPNAARTAARLSSTYPPK